LSFQEEVVLALQLQKIGTHMDRKLLNFSSRFTVNGSVRFAHKLLVCRPALVWATWDLIAMVEEGNHKGPPTHSVQFVWNHGCNQVNIFFLFQISFSNVLLPSAFKNKINIWQIFATW
jgi:hypothetical protein